MENEKKTVKKKRRRVRWGRVIIFLCILTGLLGAVGWGCFSAYTMGRSVYQDYSSMVDDFEARRALPTKFQDPKFERYTNILLLGVDEGEPDTQPPRQRSDTVIFISIDHQSGFTRLLSIPRDTKVNIPGRSAGQINQAYFYGGAQLAVRAAEDLLQAPIHHYIVADRQAFTEMVDVLGGMYLYVEHDMDYEDPEAALAIHLKKGYQYLNGLEAAQYMQYRSDELGDIGRVQRQQKCLKLLYANLLKMDTIAQIPKLLDIVNRRLVTSLAFLDTVHVAKGLSGCDSTAIKAEMLPGSYAAEPGGQYWLVDQAQVAVLVAAMFQDGEPPGAEQQ